MKSEPGVLVTPVRGGSSDVEYPQADVDAVKSGSHIAVLDGWRGISILLVLVTHLLPLGPKAWKLNYASGVMGMALFFILSGFLITSFLLKEKSIAQFLTRRFFRIIPLAWLYLAVALLIAGASPDVWLSHFLFYANLPPQDLVPLTAHMWSVCLEVQFYVGIAILVAVLGTRGLILIPLLCIVFTLVRVMNEVYASSVTYYRFDEILAGCLLALAYEGRFGQGAIRFMRAAPQPLIVPLLVLSCFLQGEWTNYFRPYFAALLVGSTLLHSDGRLARSLSNRVLAYIASVSYALYVIHPLLGASWLGSGNSLEKYAKRPLLFAALFLVAHISTYSYERPWIAFGKKLAGRFRVSSK
jgi:peptidoglycan/LPS O-acetylase OafA/YrhL